MEFRAKKVDEIDKVKFQIGPNLICMRESWFSLKMLSFLCSMQIVQRAELNCHIEERQFFKVKS